MYKALIFMVLVFHGYWCYAQEVTVGKRINIHSEILQDDRSLLIYTPPSYTINKDSTFPVLYVIDGDYNFHYVTGLVELLSNISSRIPEMIVVGISAKGGLTYRKESKPPYDIEDAGTAGKTLMYLQKDVRAYVDAHYRSNGFDVLAGHSMGGLFTTYAMLNQPEMFDVYLAISPSLWWQDQAVKTHTAKMFEKRQQVPANYYVTLGNEQGMGVHGFLELLQSKGPRSLNLHFKQFPQESHGSVGLPSYRWALEDIFAGFRISDRYFVDAQSVAKYADTMTQSYQVVFPVASESLRNTSYAHAEDKTQISAIEKALTQHFPAQVDQFRNIVVEGLLAADKFDEAEEILDRAMKNNDNNFETMANQSRLYHKQNKPKKALKSINQAIKIADKNNIRQWLMNELLEQKHTITHVE